jgi:hypothetical protein
MRKDYGFEGCAVHTVAMIIDIEMSAKFWVLVVPAPHQDTGDFEPVCFLWKLANDPRGLINRVPPPRRSGREMKDTVYSFQHPDARV